MHGIHTKIEQVNHSEVKKLSNLAKKDKVNLKDTATTKWFAIYYHNKIIFKL